MKQPSSACELRRSSAHGPKPNTTVRCGAWPEGGYLPGFSLRVRNSPRQASPIGPADDGPAPAFKRAARCRPQGDGRWAAGANCAAEKVSRDTDGPGDRWCLANDRASGPGAACKARAWGRARTRALRALTRCTCSTTASAASGGSCATGPRTEHRRAPSRSEGERRLSPGSPAPVALLAHWPTTSALRTHANEPKGPQAAIGTAAFHSTRLAVEPLR